MDRLKLDASEVLTFAVTALAGFLLAKVGGLLLHLHRRADMPRRTRVYSSHHFDSTNWNNFKPRDDDIFIATAYKSGTTFMQQIVAMLLWKGEDPPFSVSEESPWVDMGADDGKAKMAAIEAQTHRRFLKTHLPLTAMPYFPRAKYIYVGRDGRDAFMSLCNHWQMGNDNWYTALNDRPNRAGPPMPRYHPQTMTPASLFDRWLSEGWETHTWETDGWPWWSLFYNAATWWQFRDKANILHVHFSNLKKDLPGEMRRIAAFLEIPIDEERFPEQVRKCTFEYMKGNAEKGIAPAGGAFWHPPEGKEKSGGAASFFHKGVNGRWKDVLSEEQVARYEEAVKAKLTPECAHWLATGEMPAGSK
jgi:aryl sulfotransferase